MIEFPTNYTSVLEGPPGIGKHVYFIDLMKKYLENGESVTYITTEKSPLVIKETAKKAGLDLDQYEGSKFIFIDLYSHSTGERYDNGFMIDNPANLNLITVNLTKAADVVGKPMRLFFDSLSTLFLHAPEQEIKKFFGVLSSRVKTEYGSIIYSMQPEMHDPKTVVALEAMVDSVMDMRVEEGETEKSLLRVRFAKGVEFVKTWHEFTVGETGFNLLGKYVPKKEKPAAAPAAGPTTVVVEQKGLPASVIVLAGIVFMAVVAGIGYTAFVGGSGGDDASVEGPELLEVSDFYSMKMDKTVTVNGGSVDAYIDIKNRKDTKAPEKGWLVIENPYYKIEVNLENPYYRLYDKATDKEITLFNDEVENKIDMITGSDLGYGDHTGENTIQYSTTALHDDDGILRNTILYEDKANGFILLGLEGWDVQSIGQTAAGYDVEAEVLLGLFADKPYFIDMMEFNNLQKLGLKFQRPSRSPDEIVRSWVLQPTYSSGIIRGGDSEHLNKLQYEDLYRVQAISDIARKPYHFGSAAFAKMFPSDMFFGDKTSGGVIFSLPPGRPRWDDSLGVYGEQVTGEYVIYVENPEKAIAWTIEPVNEYEFLYDFVEFNKIPGYPESLQSLVEKYGMEYPGGVIDHSEWTTKRTGQVITLVPVGWYNAATNKPNDASWTLADEALASYQKYEDIIYTQMESTKPTAYMLLK